MAKSVYSVVLDDEVVRYLDLAAAKTGESRSQFINRVVAKEVGFSTYREKLDEVVTAINSFVAAHEKLRMVRRQKAAVDFLSALNYKYSPRVTYSVELFPDRRAAKLSVALRTTSPVLIELCGRFFKLIGALEEESLKRRTFVVEDGRLVRWLQIPDGADGVQAASCITDYVNYFDGLLNTYVAYPTEDERVNAVIDEFVRRKQNILV